MTVYVDDMYKYPIGQFGRMKMSHLMADTHEELVEMADKIGVQRKWIQYEGQGRYREHFDIAKGKRELAIKHGAEPIEYGGDKFMELHERWKREDRERMENN